jgi:phosphonate degradation associated HDIG domain protein
MTVASPRRIDIIDLIGDIFERRGAEAYAGEALTVAEHMLQTAALAQADGAADTLVAAALLHDIGHFTGEFGEYTPADTEDKHHDDAGATVLEGFFPPSVTACVRLHVAAKRYLCATDAAYYDKLSDASKHSLKLQGGPMTDREAAAFRRLAYSDDAIRLRRWDDSGKVTGLRTMRFAQFRPVLERVCRRNQSEGSLLF